MSLFTKLSILGLVGLLLVGSVYGTYNVLREKEPPVPSGVVVDDWCCDTPVRFDAVSLKRVDPYQVLEDYDLESVLPGGTKVYTPAIFGDLDNDGKDNLLLFTNTHTSRLPVPKQITILVIDNGNLTKIEGCKNYGRGGMDEIIVKDHCLKASGFSLVANILL